MTGRIRSGMTSSAIIGALTSNDPESLAALRACYNVLGEEDCFGFFGWIDDKQLYGGRIGQLFWLCNGDAGRFMYHVECELPHQGTGEWYLSEGSSYALLCGDNSFAAARQDRVSPNSFWALPKPLLNPYYDYPIF